MRFVAPFLLIAVAGCSSPRPASTVRPFVIVPEATPAVAVARMMAVPAAMPPWITQITATRYRFNGVSYVVASTQGSYLGAETSLAVQGATSISEPRYSPHRPDGETWRGVFFTRSNGSNCVDALGRPVAPSSMELELPAGQDWMIQAGFCSGSTETYTISGHCPADVNSDGIVDAVDRRDFLRWLELGDDRANVDDGTGTGTKDGGVDINDLLFFLRRFEEGC